MRIKSIVILALLSGLSACSTTKKPVEIGETNSQVEQPAQALSAEQLIAQAKQAPSNEAEALLIKAQDVALSEQQWRALVEASELMARRIPSQNVSATLKKAYGELQLGNVDTAMALSTQVQSDLQTSEQFYWHQLVQGTAYSKKRLPTKAVPFLIRASETATRYRLEGDYVNPVLWANLQQLSGPQLQRLDSGTQVQRGWAQLAQIKQLYLGEPMQLQQASNNWQRRFVDHPASFALDEKVAQLMEVSPYTISNVAVVLPRSGNNKQLGDAVKAGVLAALDKQKFDNLYFLDSALDNESLRAQLREKQINFVIGPLLKSNINRVEEANLFEGIPSIYLNRSDVARTSDDHFYFALAPEHELSQALGHFMAEGFEKPLILAANDNSGTRLAQYFSQQWAQYNEEPAIVGLYDNKQQMEEVITQLLEIDKSKQRIDVIEQIFTANVESETRSRRDIDVIYLLADPIDTRMLKPYLDVNISTFVERIPLYASSKSHSTRIDASDNRDLNGLYFTELPWMLPSKGVSNLTNRNLREQYQQLWPEQSELEQRLFAMGYDALTLVPQLKQLSMLPGRGVSGLTGELRVNSDGEVYRQLAWAKYQERSIVPVNLSNRTPAELSLSSQEAADNVMVPKEMAQY